MRSYYGSKANLAHLYPPPKYGKIIEPFAGSARYALRYWDREVLLVDKYETIVKMWKWLQICSPADILHSPRFKVGDKIDDFKYCCEEHRNLIGFLAAFGSSRPRHTATIRMRDRPHAMSFTLKKIAESLPKIRHWEIICGNYADIANTEATWFVDPPYQTGGHYYPEGNDTISYADLGKWSMERKGQVIVCENGNADWMPFIPIYRQKTLAGWSQEMMWTNEPTSYRAAPKELFA
jgi:site-specific DNA-adenine methylase